MTEGDGISAAGTVPLPIFKMTNIIYKYDAKKIVAVLSSKIEAGIALNVIAHLSLALGRYADGDIMGREWLLDASGIQHRGISKYPIIVTKAKPSTIRNAVEQARQIHDLFVADYPQQMLTTGHDDELAGIIAASDEKTFDYLGAIVYGPTDKVDQITRKYSLWR